MVEHGSLQIFGNFANRPERLVGGLINVRSFRTIDFEILEIGISIIGNNSDSRTCPSRVNSGV